MSTGTSRRRFLGSISAAALLPTGVLKAADTGLSAESLGKGLIWIRGAGANLLALQDAAGLVFIDGGLKAHAAQVLQLARKELGAEKAHTIINTHWHAEHTGLNEMLGKAPYYFYLARNISFTKI